MYEYYSTTIFAKLLQHTLQYYVLIIYLELQQM